MPGVTPAVMQEPPAVLNIDRKKKTERPVCNIGDEAMAGTRRISGFGMGVESFGTYSRRVEQYFAANGVKGPKIAAAGLSLKCSGQRRVLVAGGFDCA